MKNISKSIVALVLTVSFASSSFAEYEPAECGPKAFAIKNLYSILKADRATPRVTDVLRVGKKRARAESAKKKLDDKYNFAKNDADDGFLPEQSRLLQLNGYDNQATSACKVDKPAGGESAYTPSSSVTYTGDCAESFKTDFTRSFKKELKLYLTYKRKRDLVINGDGGRKPKLAELVSNYSAIVANFVSNNARAVSRNALKGLVRDYKDILPVNVDNTDYSCKPLKKDVLIFTGAYFQP